MNAASSAYSCERMFECAKPLAAAVKGVKAYLHGGDYKVFMVHLGKVEARC